MKKLLKKSLAKLYAFFFMFFVITVVELSPIFNYDPLINAGLGNLI